MVEPQPEIKLSPASLFPEAMLLLGSVWDTTVQSVLGEKSKMLDGYQWISASVLHVLWSVGHVGLREDNM